MANCRTHWGGRDFNAIYNAQEKTGPDGPVDIIERYYAETFLHSLAQAAQLSPQALQASCLS